MAATAYASPQPVCRNIKEEANAESASENSWSYLFNVIDVTCERQASDFIYNAPAKSTATSLRL